jgi:pullulanase/glycogen debranching enzyme
MSHALITDTWRMGITLTLLALGTPMLLMGDEVRRTQRGNNNAYCHDDETSWFDWTLLARHSDVHRFVKRLNLASPLSPRPGWLAQPGAGRFCK